MLFTKLLGQLTLSNSSLGQDARIACRSRIPALYSTAPVARMVTPWAISL